MNHFKPGMTRVQKIRIEKKTLDPEDDEKFNPVTMVLGLLAVGAVFYELRY